MQFRTLLKIYYKKIFFWMFLSTVFAFSVYYGIDKKLIVFSAFIISVFTEAFVGLSALIAAVPVVGPMIIKIVISCLFAFLIVVIDSKAQTPKSF